MPTSRSLGLGNKLMRRLTWSSQTPIWLFLLTSRRDLIPLVSTKKEDFILSRLSSFQPFVVLHHPDDIGKQRKNLASLTIFNLSLGVVSRLFDTKLKIEAQSFVLEDLLGVGDNPYFLMSGNQETHKRGSKVITPAVTLDFSDVSPSSSSSSSSSSSFFFLLVLLSSSFFFFFFLLLVVTPFFLYR